MHHRRARPTLRVLREQLRTDWEDPSPLRSLDDGLLEDLHPLSELPHPLIRKAVQTFGDDSSQDSPQGIIECTRPSTFYEIRMSQWRGAVWRDPATGVHWLCAAGLAKGNHKDKDDFYIRLESDYARGESAFHPDADDLRLLKQETLSRVLTAWCLMVQRETHQVLTQIADNGTKRFQIEHPTRRHKDSQDLEILADVDITVLPSCELGLEGQDCHVEFLVRPQFRGSEISWELTLTVLTALCPYVQEWDLAGGVYSMIGERGSWVDRATILAELVARGELAPSVPSQVSHYCHREHLAGSTIAGDAVMGMCGVFFVPTQDHEKLPTCPKCQEAHDKLAF
jgi:hypothetical protein